MAPDSMQDMPDVLGIQAAIEAAAHTTPMVQTSGLSLKKGLFDGEDSNVLFDADVPCGVTVKGQRSLLVRGSVLGVSGNPCQLQGGADVVVAGDVLHAHIHGRNIYVAGKVRDSRLFSMTDIRISGSVADSRLMAGAFETRRIRIEKLERELERSRDECERLERRVSVEERRMDKACQATRIPLDFNVGRLVQHKDGRLHVDLSSFYHSMADSSPRRVQLALMELFAKGVVGVLARTNQKYLVNFPAREKIFMQLLQNLRELFFLVHEFETLKQRRRQAGDGVETMLRQLNGQAPVVSVQGAALPGTELEFVLPQARRLEDGGLSFRHESAGLQVQDGLDGDHCRLLLQNLEGDPSPRDLTRAELQGLSFRAGDGRIAWEPLAPGTQAAA